MIRGTRCILATFLFGALVGCADQRQYTSDGPISQHDTMMEQAAAMLTAPSYNEGLARQTAIGLRNRRTNAQFNAQ